uniref:Uncharacterized protein n=1 Tax=Arundo donax TaxID=35708 RepID=A0A0A9HE33_ARUDO
MRHILLSLSLNLQVEERIS